MAKYKVLIQVTLLNGLKKIVVQKDRKEKKEVRDLQVAMVMTAVTVVKDRKEKLEVLDLQVAMVMTAAMVVKDKKEK